MSEELIGVARELREAGARGAALGLSDDELAFYDALGVNAGPGPRRRQGSDPPSRSAAARSTFSASTAL